ncbi:MAG: glycosyltransferase family 4 protein [Gordonibacter sp.]
MNHEEKLNIALVAPGFLPVPAVCGGAVETLMDSLIAYNEANHCCNLFIFSPHCTEARQAAASLSSTRWIGIGKEYTKRKASQKKILPLRWHARQFQRLAALACHDLTQLDAVILENEFAGIRFFKNTVPLVLHAHNDYFSDTRISSSLQLDRLCKSFIAVSDPIRQAILSTYPKACVTVVPNGIDTHLFHPMTNSPSLRKKIGCSEDAVVIVFTGRLSQEKGVLELVEAFNKIHPELNAKLIIIGSSQFASNRADRYTRLVHRTAQANKNITCLGFIPHDQLASYLQTSDIGCVPSIWDEPFGLTLVEHLASGLPVVVSDSGILSTLAGPDCSIVATRGRDFVPTLTRAFEALAQNKTLRDAMGGAARQRAGLYSQETFAEHFFNHLAAICQKGAS